RWGMASFYQIDDMQVEMIVVVSVLTSGPITMPNRWIWGSATTRKKMIRIPYGSRRLSASAWRGGRRLTMIRPPSSGGMGIKLKTISTTLMMTEYQHIQARGTRTMPSRSLRTPGPLAEMESATDGSMARMALSATALAMARR